MQGARTFFSEIISSISDLRFTRDGRFLVSRDYMTLKLWDIRMETGPVSTHNVHENLRSRVRPREAQPCGPKNCELAWRVGCGQAVCPGWGSSLTVYVRLFDCPFSFGTAEALLSMLW